MTSLSESIREWDSFVGSIFLTRSLLSHPSLMSQRIDDFVRELHRGVNTVSSSRIAARQIGGEREGKERRLARARSALTVRLRGTAGPRCRRARPPRHGTLSSKRRPFLTGLPPRARVSPVVLRPIQPDDAPRRTANSQPGWFIYTRNLHARPSVRSLSTWRNGTYSTSYIDTRLLPGEHLRRTSARTRGAFARLQTASTVRTTGRDSCFRGKNFPRDPRNIVGRARPVIET